MSVALNYFRAKREEMYPLAFPSLSLPSPTHTHNSENDTIRVDRWS